MHSLNNKLVCITGASSGIGAACATEFARLGCSLLLVARRKERLEALARELCSQHGIKVKTMVLDVRKQQDVKQGFASLEPPWENIDILVNNAGLSR